MSLYFFLYENNKVSTFKGQDYPRVDSLVKKIESKNNFYYFSYVKIKKFQHLECHNLIFEFPPNYLFFFPFKTECIEEPSCFG